MEAESEIVSHTQSADIWQKSTDNAVGKGSFQQTVLEQVDEQGRQKHMNSCFSHLSLQMDSKWVMA